MPSLIWKQNGLDLHPSAWLLSAPGALRILTVFILGPTHIEVYTSVCTQECPRCLGRYFPQRVEICGHITLQNQSIRLTKVQMNKT